MAGAAINQGMEDQHMDPDSADTVTEVRDTGPEIEKPNIDIGKAARQGGAWSAISYAFSKFTGFASSIVLARVLMPEHFGLIGMTNTVLGLVQVLGVLGIGASLMHQREDIEDYANTGWWMDVLCGIALFGVSNALSPLAALYYHEPEVRAVILVASMNYLINPIGTTMDVLLRRDLQFKVSTRITLVQGILASVLTIIFACLGAGVWSFVVPHLITGIVIVALRWKASTFRPTLKVKWSIAAGIWRFGRNVFGSTIFDYVNQNVDYILVGGLMGGKQLGLYTFAYSLGTWIVGNITGTISSVLFPTFASVQDDREKARALFLKLIRTIATIGFPIVAVEWAVAPLFVGTVYGEKWLPSVTAFRLIALYGMGRAVCAPGSTLISALGKPEIGLKASAGMCPVLVTAIYIGSKHGINGVALATAIAHGAFVWFYLIVPFRVLKWNPFDAARALAAPLVSSVLASITTAAVYAGMGAGTASLWKLGLVAMVGGVSYMLFYQVLFPSVSLEMRRLVRTLIRDAR